MDKSLQGITRENLEKLDKATLIDMLLLALSRLEKLDELVVSQGEQVQQLKDQIAKNSQNSGKPPSSDGLKKKKTKSLRKKRGRQSGGQKGHKGHTLMMVENPEYEEKYEVTKCPHCETNLMNEDVIRLEKRQVFDIPEIKIEVTEHQVEVKSCPCCQHEAKAAFPENVTSRVQYGSRIKAQIVYFNQYQLLPWSRTCETIADLYGHQPAEALVQVANEQFVDQADAAVTAIKEQVIATDVAHFDETGMRVMSKLHWLHTASTDLFTYYGIHQKRGQDGMRAINVLPLFQGRAIHDHWKPYFKFTHCQHGLCNAHHLRELRFITEQYQQPWAEKMGQLLLDIKETVAQLPDSATQLPSDILTEFSETYDTILTEGFQANPICKAPVKKRGRPKQSPPKNLLDRLHNCKPQVLAFMYDTNVPFDNNLAERDVRMVKVKQKISGSFRTLSGAEIFCAIRSYISTVRKHGLNVIDAIYDVFSGAPLFPCVPE